MKSPIKLKCPNCGNPIRADDINILDLVAKCSKCACIFPFKASLFEKYSVSLKADKKPSNIGIHQQGKELLLTYRWWNKRFFMLLILGILWNSSTLMWFMITLANDAYFMAMLGMIYAIGGIALLYTGFAGFLNVTSLKVDDFQLSVSHQPVPWSPSPKLRKDHAVQLYCTLYITHGQHYMQTSYQLHAILKNGKKVCILKGLVKAEEAQYLERKIEEFWGIKDQFVPGEYES